jgi:hypothetical protein
MFSIVLAAAGLMLAAGSAALGDSDNASIRKIADMIKKGDMAGAKKAAADYAKKNPDVDFLMHAFKPTKKKGIGFEGGDTGIEQKLVQVGRDAPTASSVDKSAAAYEQMGYDVAAVALITELLPPEKDSGKKTRKAWVEWSQGMAESGMKMAEAGKAKSPADIKTAATKINQNCNSCHSTFR